MSEALSLLGCLGPAGITLLWGAIIASLAIPALRRRDQMVVDLEGALPESGWWIPLAVIGGGTFLSGSCTRPTTGTR